MFLAAGTIIETKELWDELQTSLKDAPLRVLFEQPQIGDWPAFARKVESLRPDVVFLDVSKLRDVLDVIRKIRSIPGGPAVFALHTQAEPGTILEALRAGVSEYLYPPFGEALRTGLERIASERLSRVDAVSSGGKVLGFLSAKGGCGATTIACHIGIEIPRQSEARVLLADLDLEAGMVGFLLKAKSPYSVIDALENLHRLDASYWKALVTNGFPGLEILTAPSGAAVQQAVQAEQIEYVFRFIRTQYDWALMDLGRGLSTMRLGALQHCDQIFLVTTAEIPALYMAQQMIVRLIESGYGRERLNVLLNRPPRRFDVAIQELEQMLGATIYSVIPNDYGALNECYTQGKLAGSASSVGKSYADLARKITGLGAKSRKKFSLFG